MSTAVEEAPAAVETQRLPQRASFSTDIAAGAERVSSLGPPASR